MALANYAASGLSERTAYLEIHGHGEIFHWKKTNESGYFTDGGIHFYPNLKKEQIPILLNRDYDRLIMDFGDAYDVFREELLWCERKVFLLNLNPWQEFAARKMVNTAGEESWGGIRPVYAGVNPQKKIQKNIEKECRIRIMEVPFIANPGMVGEEAFAFMDFILGSPAAKEKNGRPAKRKKLLLPARRRK